MKNLCKLLVILLLVSSCDSNPKKQLAETDASLEKIILVQHTVQSNGHPIAVWEKKVDAPKGIILFVHGRTWSAVPDFDLQVNNEELSLMDGMRNEGYTTYAVDLRGYGATPRDSTQWMWPNKGAKDISNVLRWLSKRHNNTKIHLFGWSMGSTLSLLSAQQNSEHIASLSLFGFWLDIDNTIPEDVEAIVLEQKVNTAEAAASDFIVPGSISKNAIDTYVDMALQSDPIRVDWKKMSQYNTIDPAQIKLPVLLLQGELDPIAPTPYQSKLFTTLGTADKSWAVIPGGDHAAFMETPRPYFIHTLARFIDSFNE